MLSYVGRSGSLLPFHSATTQLLASPAKAIVPCVLEKSQVKVQMDVDQKKPTLVTGTINRSINQWFYYSPPRRLSHPVVGICNL